MCNFIVFAGQLVMNERTGGRELKWNAINWTSTEYTETENFKYEWNDKFFLFRWHSNVEEVSSHLPWTWIIVLLERIT